MIQGVVGFGLVLTAGPVVALLEPSALPVVFLLLGFPMEIWMLIREHAAVDRPGFVQMMGGRAAGTVAAFWVLTVAGARMLAVLAGSAIVIAGLLSYRSPRASATSRPVTMVIAGSVSGLMATVAAVGGPAMALAYRDREAAQVRATLALAFLVGGSLSLAALQFAGMVTWEHLRLALVLLPAEAIGLALSGFLLPRVHPGALRAAVLLLAVLGGAAVVLRALL